MRHLAGLAILCALAAACLWFAGPVFARPETVVEYYEWGHGFKQIKAKYFIDAQKRKQGEYLEFFPKGTRKIKATYQDGILDGPYIEYYDTGVEHILCAYAANERHGAYTENYPSKKLKITATYRHGKLDGKFTEQYEGGGAHLQLNYRDGKLSGAFTANYNSGKLKLKTTYANDRIDGAMETYYPTGKLRIRCQYAKGELQGAYEDFRADGTPRCKITYPLAANPQPCACFPDAKGEVGAVLLYSHAAADRNRLSETIKAAGGIPVIYPKTPYEIISTLRNYDIGDSAPTEYETPPSVTAPYVAGKLSHEYLLTGLRRTQIYRYLCDLPYADMDLKDEYCDFAQHGAVLLHRHGALNHYPPKPDDMPQDFYEKGYQGTSNGNIYLGTPSIVDSVDGYMDDSDPTNIGHVGHRRWILQSYFRSTGFGLAERSSTMWVQDQGRPDCEGPAYTAFPSCGYYPATFFQPHYAWSVQLNNRSYDNPLNEKVAVHVWELDDAYQPTTELVIRDKTVDMSIDACVIFRPELTGNLAGRRFRVEITGLRDCEFNHATIEYHVEFFNPDLD